MKMGRPKSSLQPPGWFNVSEYPNAINLSDRDLYSNVKVRWELIRALDIPTTTPTSLLHSYWSFIQNKPNASYEEIKQLENKHDKEVIEKRGPKMSGFLHLTPNNRRENKAVLPLDVFNAIEVTAILEGLDKPFDSDRMFNHYNEYKKYLIVDLDNPTSLIKTQFEHWLQLQKENHATQKNCTSKKIRNLIGTNRLLEYSDLLTWVCLTKKEEYPPRFYIDAIFPLYNFTNPNDKYNLMVEYHNNIFNKNSVPKSLYPYNN
ncbi:MAG: hypothetical protein Q9M92_07435 [Enterobacterales bacterium]|nr:hypothetical protein [Enterobacterales bacterium]